MNSFIRIIKITKADLLQNRVHFQADNKKFIAIIFTCDQLLVLMNIPFFRMCVCLNTMPMD